MEHEKARRIADRLAQYEMEELLADQRHAAKQRDEFSWWNWYGKPLLWFIFVYAVAAGILLCSFNAVAETRLVVNLASSHLRSPDFEMQDKGIAHYNEENYGLGVEYHSDGSALYYGAGFYENSFFKMSRYLTIGAKAHSPDNLYLSAEISIADGYELSPESRGDYLIAPGVAYNAQFGDEKQHAMKALFMVGGVFGLQYSYRFGE